MRFFVGLVLVLALGVMGCSEASGACGWQGSGGGAHLFAPGLWRTEPTDDTGALGCVYVNEDCTALVESAECDVREDETDAHVLELEWIAGENEMGETCAAGISVSADDLVAEAPISETFFMRLTDADGGEWEIEGIFISGGLGLEATRTMGDGSCSGAAWLFWRR